MIKEHCFTEEWLDGFKSQEIHLSKLFEYIENMEVVATSFQAFAKQEIEYRKNGDPDHDLTPEKVISLGSSGIQ